MIRKLLLAATLVTVLSSGVISAVQLRTSAKAFPGCGTTCTSQSQCGRPCFCFRFIEGSPTGNCQPEGPAPLRMPR